MHCSTRKIIAWQTHDATRTHFQHLRLCKTLHACLAPCMHCSSRKFLAGQARVGTRTYFQHLRPCKHYMLCSTSKNPLHVKHTTQGHFQHLRLCNHNTHALLHQKKKCTSNPPHNDIFSTYDDVTTTRVHGSTGKHFCTSNPQHKGIFSTYDNVTTTHMHRIAPPATTFLIFKHNSSNISNTRNDNNSAISHHDNDYPPPPPSPPPNPLSPSPASSALRADRSTQPPSLPHSLPPLQWHSNPYRGRKAAWDQGFPHRGWCSYSSRDSRGWD